MAPDTEYCGNLRRSSCNLAKLFSPSLTSARKRSRLAMASTTASSASERSFFFMFKYSSATLSRDSIGGVLAWDCTFFNASCRTAVARSSGSRASGHSRAAPHGRVLWPSVRLGGNGTCFWLRFLGNTVHGCRSLSGGSQAAVVAVKASQSFDATRPLNRLRTWPPNELHPPVRHLDLSPSFTDHGIGRLTKMQKLLANHTKAIGRPRVSNDCLEQNGPDTRSIADGVDGVLQCEQRMNRI